MRRPLTITGALALALALNITSIHADSARDDLGWLSGHWCGDSDGARIEELWLPMAGDVMLALNRTIAGERTTGFEYLRIVQDADQQIRYVAQPGGRPPTSFALTARGEAWARFENPDHDFPQRIEYRRKGATLTAEISGPGGEDGALMSIRLQFRPCRS